MDDDVTFRNGQTLSELRLLVADDGYDVVRIANDNPEPVRPRRPLDDPA